jgi:hypothetical protein
MITWKVDAKDVYSGQFTLIGLLNFSKKWNACVIIPGVLTLTSGVVTYVN